MCGPTPSLGKARTLFGLPGEYKAIVVTGLGRQGLGFNKNEQIYENLEAVRTAAAAGCRALQDLEVDDIEIESFGAVGATAEGSQLGTWKYQGPSGKKPRKAQPVVSLYNCTDTEAWNAGINKAKAQNFARRLMDTPANLMTPTIFAKEAVDKLSKLGVTVNVYDKEWAEQQKLGSYLSVTRGSAEPPKFLELNYNGKDKTTPPVALVGKGITFDSGGISLKQSAHMDEMRADMGGAACVVGTFMAIAALKVPINIKGFVPLCENMPGGKATKPGDLVTARNGKTIIVDNTDAEGRLILADALCLAAESKPKLIIDMATLTGAMCIALGEVATGAFTNSDEVWEQINKAGALTGDRVWRFPLWDYYSKKISGPDFPNCDVNNIGKPGTGGGSCIAAAFLKEFVEDVPWMHLDIAPVMSADGKNPSYLSSGMAGRPVRTLVQLLEQLANDKKNN